MKRKTSAPVGASLIVLSSFFYASYGVWTQLMGNFFGGYTASALRSVLVLLILVPIAIAYKKLGAVNWERNWRYLAIMFFASLFVWGPLYYSILHAGIGISLTINYACIVVGMFFFGWLFARERFTRDKWLSAGLGMTGLVLIYLPSVSSIGWVALGAAALSGFSIAAVTVVAKLIPYSVTQSAIALWATSVAANLVMIPLVQESLPAIGWHVQWAYLVIFAIASVIASWTLIRGVKLVEAGAAGVLGLLEIVFGVAFGVALFGERPGLIVLFGAIVIITAAAIPYIKDFNLSRGSLDVAD